ncbi:MAG: glycosyltransferase, partial [Solirubrobacterales bacterium]
MPPPPAPRVAILLSTYNGAPFLPAQLESFLAQSMPDWLLYWRDDGSSDVTSALMEDFAAGPGQGKCHFVPGPGHLGATESFMALLRAAAPTGLPLAFADQDDV